MSKGENMSLWHCEEYMAEIERLRAELSAMTAERNGYRLDVDTLMNERCCEIDTLKAKLKEVERERDEARRQLRRKDPTAWSALDNEYHKATQRAERYKKALEAARKYLQGENDCANVPDWAMETVDHIISKALSSKEE